MSRNHVFFYSADILAGECVLEHSVTFLSLKPRITDLLLKALLIETDSTNTQMLLG